MATPIATRSVLLIPGFDPAPARVLRERFRREGAAQAEISGYSIAFQADPEAGAGHWYADAVFGPQAVSSQFEVMEWSDLVQAETRNRPLSGYMNLFRVVWTYLRTGAFPPIVRLRKGPVLAALYPVFVIFGQVGLAVLLGAVIFGGTQSLWAEHTLAVLLALPLGCGAALAVLLWCARHDTALRAHHLMANYAHACRDNGCYAPALSDRLAQFSSRLHAIARSEADEVLLIGHSAGAHLAVTVLADVLRRGGIPQGRTLSLLTLGHVVPMVSFLPEATRLRRDLAYLSDHPQIAWVDVSAPGDGCSFALCDPVSVTGVAPAAKRWPLILSAAFTQTLSPQTWARLRWRFYRLHFQYMCAFDHPGLYDFFAITTGPLSLADRFAGVTPSPSRIETPVNRYRST